MFLSLLYMAMILAYGAWGYLLWSGLRRFGEEEGGKKELQEREVVQNTAVVVPFRNEAGTIGRLLLDLTTQTISPREVLLIDDHSTDGTAEVIRQFSEGKDLPFHIRVLSNKGEGKKEALKTALAATGCRWILQTDADCHLPGTWVGEMCAALAGGAGMAAAPVWMKGDGTSTGNFQEVEFASLQLTTAATFAMNHPIMCNGANMAYRRQLYLNFLESGQGGKFSSGDDVFFLHYLLREKVEMKYLCGERATVHSPPEESFADFFRQRLRWAGKSRGYRSRFTLSVAAFVFLTAFASFPLSVAGFFYGASPAVAAFLLVRGSVDYLLLMEFYKKLGKKSLTPLSFLGAFIWHPLYIQVVALSGLFYRPGWKGRKIS